MKTMIAIIGMVVTMASMALAYEVEGNPDHKISFGFNYDRGESNSEYSFHAIKQSDFVKITGNSYMLDVRIPLSSFFTFSAHGGLNDQNNAIFTGETVDYKGYDMGVGIRLYIP